MNKQETADDHREYLEYKRAIWLQDQQSAAKEALSHTIDEV